MAKREQKYTEYTRIERALDWTAIDDRVLVKWAELFEEYCITEYGDDARI